jgi:PleD family two-component response regulator
MIIGIITTTAGKVLDSTGLFEVNSFNHPAQALYSFASNSYAIVILDIMMRDMDGF